jgi:hypothetical protein
MRLWPMVQSVRAGPAGKVSQFACALTTSGKFASKMTMAVTRQFVMSPSNPRRPDP